MCLKYITKKQSQMSNSFINPLLIRSIFKGFVFRAKKLRSKKNLEEELNFLDVHVENVCN